MATEDVTASERFYEIVADSLDEMNTNPEAVATLRGALDRGALPRTAAMLDAFDPAVARGRSSGVTVEQRGYAVFRMRDGRVLRCIEHADVNMAREAAGSQVTCNDPPEGPAENSEVS